MKLSTKILLLIAPVILCSTAASSYIIYSNQKSAFIKREDNALQLNMEKLAGHFRQAHSFLNSYTYTLTKSDIVRRYFALEHNSDIERKLITNLQETIQLLQDGETSYTGLALLDGNQDVLYYAENRNERTAQLDPKILEHIRFQYQNNAALSNISYTQNSQGEGVLMRYEVLDKKTLASPLHESHSSDVFFVVVAVSLDAFNTLRKQIEYEYQTSLFFSDGIVSVDKGLAQSVELSSGLFATVDPAQFLLNNRLDNIWNKLSASFALSALLTMALLLALLYRTVINPITRLNTQLTQVERKQRKNIEKLGTEDEIGRLSERFYDMYQELDNTYQRTKKLAESDQLTQIANRHQFQNYVEKVLIDSNSHHLVWILYLDLDNFKFVNDKYGHQIGDSILVSFAKHISSVCQLFRNEYLAISMPSRLSGDEFAVYLRVPSKFDDAAQVFAQLLLEPLQNGFVTPMGSFPITVSIGIARYPDDGRNIEKLLSNADTAMYQAKRAGKNQFALYSLDLDKVVQRRANIERALRENNFDEEFHLVFMPYLDINGIDVIGVEVLLRWYSPQLGLVSPDEFIPIAEQTGLFQRIDKWVIKNAFARFHDIQAQFKHDVHLSINLSSAELETTKLAKYIDEHAKQNNIPPALIDFEITETFANESQGFPLLNELSRLGYRLAIDDFGSGYTSITQLVQYPVQKIKLDKGFLETLIKTDNQNIIKPIIELCHAQNKAVTAEGIETKSMYQWLANYQCDFMQGYYFGKPMNLDELSPWYLQLKENSK
ncbi:EAL domain-containing protein [Vibrio profundi]|uniref:putative bifunctional diguanylate cyclase/phosphodiesterase n=1 Tax=Vibrio profundi TaxID=1774960 RepID=UPI003736747D